MHYHKSKQEMKKIRKRNYRKFDIRTSFHRQLLIFFFSKCFALKQTEPQVNHKHEPNIMQTRNEKKRRKRNYREFDTRTCFQRQLLIFFFSKRFALKQTEPQVNRKHSPNIMSACVNRLVSWDELAYFGNQFIQTTNAQVSDPPMKAVH